MPVSSHPSLGNRENIITSGRELHRGRAGWLKSRRRVVSRAELDWRRGGRFSGNLGKGTGLFGVLVAGLILGGLSPVAKAAPVAWQAPKVKPDAGRGKKVYFKYCVYCHGRFGKGDGPSGKALPQNPANFTDRDFMSIEPDKEFFKVISEGGGSVGITPFMPSFGHTLKHQDIHDVLVYIRTFCKCQYDPRRAREHEEHEKKEHHK